MLTGTLAPDSGHVKLGANLQMAALDQSRDSLDPDWTLKEALTGGKGGDTVTIGSQTKHVIGYMKDFLFSPEQIGTPLRALSGGERGRVMLARALAKPSNLLILDEPTNDLDLETLDVLEEALGDYAGTVILISHDRDFLDRVVSAVIVPEGDGAWDEYAGGYSDMLKQRGRDISLKKSQGAAEKRAAAKSAGETPAGQRQEAAQLQGEIRAGQSAETDGGAGIAKSKYLQRKLDDPKLFTRDRKAFDEASAALSAAQAELHDAEEKWLALELLREEVEGA